MSEPVFEMLDFANPDVHAVAAARLLTHECADRSYAITPKTESPEEDVGKFISSYASPTGKVYALIETHSGVLAASLVTHHYINAFQGSPAHISHLAVHPHVRRQGYGTRLIRHIADQAVAQGDDIVQYYATYDYNSRSDEYGFLNSLHFREIMLGILQVPVAKLLTQDKH